MSSPDEFRIRHMLEAAQEAVQLNAGRSREDLDTNRLLMLSTVQLIAILGEAASRVSGEFQQANSQVPWSDIIATRNQLIHAYFSVDLDIVWDIVTNDLPSLVTALEKLLPPAEGE